MHPAILTLFLTLTTPPPLGKLVDIGGYRVHLYCTGKGKQTVILSPGGGDFSFDWFLVQQKVSKFARVCSYDRADSSWSDPGPQPRTLRQEAYEIHLAIDKAKEHGPYILVGHSIGGLVVRIFAQRYPKEVSGMVLVDALSPDATLGYNGKLVHMRELAKAVIPDVQTMKSSPPQLLREEDRKSSTSKISPPFDRLPPKIQQLQLWAKSQPPRAAQGQDCLPEEMNELYQHSSVTSIPLITIIGMRSDRAPKDVPQQEWDALFREKVEQKRAFRELSTNSKVVEDQKAGHAVQLDDPEAVVSAIQAVLK